MKSIEKHFSKIVLFVLLITFLQQCGNGRRLSSLEKQTKAESLKLDSVCTEEQIKKIVEIEGLKAEKRMIQSTDRKILDVNRQTQIDEELKKLGGN